MSVEVGLVAEEAGPDAIGHLSTDGAEAPRYDLQGRRLPAPCRGVPYVQKGRKVMK